MLSINYICNKLKLYINSIVSAYIYDSYSWNTNNSNSYYDLIIIFNDVKNKLCVYKDNIDATTYDITTFQNELNENKFVPVITQLLDKSKILEKHK